jgi:hypothetical protein
MGNVRKFARAMDKAPNGNGTEQREEAERGEDLRSQTIIAAVQRLHAQHQRINGLIRHTESLDPRPVDPTPEIIRSIEALLHAQTLILDEILAGRIGRHAINWVPREQAESPRITPA